MNRDQKAAVIEEVAAQIRDAEAVFAIDYRGISVRQAGNLRIRLREAGASFRVVKNTLTERAAEAAGTVELKQYLEGPTAFAFVRGDAALAAKALAAFRRETRLLEFKGGLMGEQTLSAEDIDAIARLPAREALQWQFVGVLASPLTGLVRGLAGLVSGLAVQLGKIQEQGLIGEGADATAEAGSAEAGSADGAGGAEASEGAGESGAPASEGSGESGEDGARSGEGGEAETTDSGEGAEPGVAETTDSGEGPEPGAAETTDSGEGAEPAAPGDPVSEAAAAEEESTSDEDGAGS